MQLSMQCRQAWPKGAVLAHRVAAFEHSTGMTGGSNVRANEAVDWFGVGAGGMKQRQFATKWRVTGRMTDVGS
jgi:hypothetical protein